jgi:hypothetical protein
MSNLYTLKVTARERELLEGYPAARFLANAPAR